MASEPTLATTAPADLALVRAIRAWGHSGEAGEGTNPFAFLARFSADYRERILEIWFSIARMTPELAWQTLLRDHQAAARFDPSRVHPSWFVRILNAESPAVRALVTARATGVIRAALDQDPHPGPASITSTNHPAHPEAVAWALTLWSERLVGDIPESPSDPPVILALTQFSWRDQYRLVRAVGQVKLAFAIEGLAPHSSDEARVRVRPTDRVRIAYFRRTIGQSDPRLIPIARRDFESITAEPSRQFAAVGLLTVARLLKGYDRHRVRWAIQHVPYPIAKRFGKLGSNENLGSTGLSPRALQVWESWILEAAWARLLSEGRLGQGGGRVWV